MFVGWSVVIGTVWPYFLRLCPDDMGVYNIAIRDWFFNTTGIMVVDRETNI